MTGRGLVLYIEDNEFNARLVERLLTANGFQYLGAADAASGLVSAERSTPDLILMDINLPGLDGYEATMKLRSIPSLRSVPIVAVTANAMPGDRERALSSGCVGYMAKPIDVDSFVASVEAYIAGRRDELDDRRRNTFLEEHNLRLVRKLEQKIAELEGANQNLEILVGERTRALREAQERVIDLERTKAVSEIAGTVAHELRQPLSIITGFAEFLDDEALPAAERHALHERIVEQVQRMVGIIDKLGRIVRYETQPYHQDRIIDLESAADAEEARPLRVLIVDDEAAIGTIISRHLSGAFSCETVVRISAEGARDALDGGDFDLCFLDVHLPGVSGLQFLPEILNRRPAVRVILITGLISERDREEAMGQGAAACLIKPVRRQDLLDAVRRVVPPVLLHPAP